MSVPRIIIRDLGRYGDRDELHKVYNRFGVIRNIWIATNPPGFAYVFFNDSRDAMKAVTSTNGKVVCGERVRVEYLPTEDKKAFHSRLSTVEGQSTRGEGGGRGGRGGKRGRGSKFVSHGNRSPDRRTPPPRSPPHPHYRSSPPRHHSPLPRRSPPHFSRRTPPRRTPPPSFSRHTPPPSRRTPPPSRHTPPPLSRHTPPPSRRTPPRRTPPPSHRTPPPSHYHSGSPGYHHRRPSPLPPHSDYHSHHHHTRDNRHSHHYPSRTSRHDSYNHHQSRSSPPPSSTHHNESSKHHSRSYNSSSSSSHDYRSEPSYSSRSNDMYRRNDRYDNQYSSRSSRRDERESFNAERYKHERPSSRGGGGMLRYRTPTPPPMESRSHRSPSPRHYSSSSHPLSPSPNHMRENDLHYRSQRSRKDHTSDKMYRSDGYCENHHTPREGHGSSSQERRSHRKISRHISRQEESKAEIRSRSHSPHYDNPTGDHNDYILYNDESQYTTNHSPLPHPSFDDNGKLSDNVHFSSTQKDYDKSRIKSPIKCSPRHSDYAAEGESIQFTTDNNDNEKPYNSLPSDEGNFEFGQEPDAFNLDNQFFQLEELKGDSARHEDPVDEEPSAFYSQREITFSPHVEREVIRVSAGREVVHMSRSPSPRRDRLVKFLHT